MHQTGSRHVFLPKTKRQRHIRKKRFYKYALAEICCGWRLSPQCSGWLSAHSFAKIKTPEAYPQKAVLQVCTDRRSVAEQRLSPQYTRLALGMYFCQKIKRQRHIRKKQIYKYALTRDLLRDDGCPLNTPDWTTARSFAKSKTPKAYTQKADLQVCTGQGFVEGRRLSPLCTKLVLGVQFCQKQNARGIYAKSGSTSMHWPMICRGTEAVPAMPRQDYGMYFCQNQNAKGIYAKKWIYKHALAGDLLRDGGCPRNVPPGSWRVFLPKPKRQRHIRKKRFY
jgi:hypothetical protein